jgi:hypothetical protein
VVGGLVVGGLVVGGLVVGGGVVGGSVVGGSVVGGDVVPGERMVVVGTVEGADVVGATELAGAPVDVWGDGTVPTGSLGLVPRRGEVGALATGGDSGAGSTTTVVDPVSGSTSTWVTGGAVVVGASTVSPRTAGAVARSPGSRDNSAIAANTMAIRPANVHSTTDSRLQ